MIHRLSNIGCFAFFFVAYLLPTISLDAALLPLQKPFKFHGHSYLQSYHSHTKLMRIVLAAAHMVLNDIASK